MTRVFIARVLTVASLLVAAPLAAAEPAKGDPKAGHALVYTCGGCHGVAGYENAYPNYHVPRIAGQKLNRRQ